MAQDARGFWGTLFGAPIRNRFSVEELDHLHSVLLRNSVVNDVNRETVVETLRSISELVIWGDQHDQNLVEYFLTNNMLSHFSRILQQRSNRRGGVAQQVLQTLSILLQNVRHQQTIYYLFSNNHINDIVSLRFDFDDDEVLGYYINLLKTISLRLNEATIQFFFQAPGPDGGPAAALPLYSEAIKFIGHRDGMVRAAVKTLTLNVYAVPLPAVHAFVTSPGVAAYPETLAALLAAQCGELDRRLVAVEDATPAVLGALSGCLAEIEDMLSYCNDVLATGIEPLRCLLLDALWKAVIGPVLFWPLIQDDVGVRHIHQLAWGLSPEHASRTGSGTALGRAAGEETVLALRAGAVGPLTALYVLERLFVSVTDTPLLSGIVAALFDGSAFFQLSPAELAVLQYSPAAYRAALVGMTADAGHEPQLAIAAARLLAALLSSRTLDEGLMESIGLLPRRRMRQLELLTALTKGSAADDASWGPATRAGNRGTTGGVDASDPGTASPDAPGSPTQSSPSLPLPPLTDPAGAEARRAELVDALLAQLGGEWIPPRALCTLGWLLTQLLVDGPGGAALTAAQRAALAHARGVAEGRLEGAVVGASAPWADGCLALVAATWGATRRCVTSGGAGALHVAVGVWAELLSSQARRWSAEIEAGDGGAAAGRAPDADGEDRLLDGAYAVTTAVASAVALSCTCFSLLRGAVPAECPVAGDVGVGAPVREGFVLPALKDVGAGGPGAPSPDTGGGAPPPAAFACTVSFSRGLERRVSLRVEAPPGTPTATDKATSTSTSTPPLPPRTAVVLAELVDGAWVAIATAPLLGAEARHDTRHAKWLRVSVRPPVAALVAALSAPNDGQLALPPRARLATRLSIGQWTVAFRDEATASAALSYIDACGAATRASVLDGLRPLLAGPTP